MGGQFIPLKHVLHKSNHCSKSHNMHVPHMDLCCDTMRRLGRLSGCEVCSEAKQTCISSTNDLEVRYATHVDNCCVVRARTS